MRRYLLSVLLLGASTPLLLGSDCVHGPRTPSTDFDPDFQPYGSAACMRCGEQAWETCHGDGSVPARYVFSADGRTCQVQCASGRTSPLPLNGGPGEPCGFMINVQASPIRGLCPTELLMGDRDFFGHGPRMDIDVQVHAAADGGSVVADVEMEATETGDDLSAVHGEWPGAQIATFGGFFHNQIRIVGLATSTPVDISWTASGGGVQSVPLGPGDSMLTSLTVVGDTGDADIATDAARCDDDTHIVDMQFRPVRILVESR